MRRGAKKGGGSEPSERRKGETPSLRKAHGFPPPRSSMGVKTKSKIKPLYFAMAMSVFVILAFYVFLTNSMAGDRFESQLMRQKIEKLKEENETLELSASQVQSLASLQERSEKIGLETSAKIRYVRVRAKELVFGN